MHPQPFYKVSINKRSDGGGNCQRTPTSKLPLSNHHLTLSVRQELAPLLYPPNITSGFPVAIGRGAFSICHAGEIALAKLCGQGSVATFLEEEQKVQEILSNSRNLTALKSIWKNPLLVRAFQYSEVLRSLLWLEVWLLLVDNTSQVSKQLKEKELVF